MAGQTTLYLSGYRRSHFLYSKRQLSSGLHPASQLCFGEVALQGGRQDFCTIFEVCPLVDLPLLALLSRYGNANEHDQGQAEYREEYCPQHVPILPFSHRNSICIRKLRGDPPGQVTARAAYVKHLSYQDKNW
jgi:hypothetical protein